MPGPGGWWAGRSPITSAPSWSWTPCRWRSGGADPPTVRPFTTPTTAQYTSWAFGRRLRSAGLLGSMGTVGDAYDNAVAESFFSTLQRELLDETPRWESRHQLAQAVFEWIEAWYNPRRRHSHCARLSPINYETAHWPDPSEMAA